MEPEIKLEGTVTQSILVEFFRRRIHNPAKLIPVLQFMSLSEIPVARLSIGGQSLVKIYDSENTNIVFSPEPKIWAEDDDWKNNSYEFFDLNLARSIVYESATGQTKLQCFRLSPAEGEMNPLWQFILERTPTVKEERNNWITGYFKPFCD